MQKVFYQDTNATVFNGDCFDLLKEMDDDSVDVVVTSPPYNTLENSKSLPGMHKNNAWIKKVIANSYDDNMNESEYQVWLSGVVQECLRVSKGLVWVNHKIRFRDKEALHPARFLDFPIYSEVIWSRGTSMVLNAKKFAPSHEYIFGFGKPHFWNNKTNTMFSVWEISKEKTKSENRTFNHPCPFPLEIPLRCINASCPPGGIVLDPFAGTGTTLRAAKELGMISIGMEKEKRFCTDIQNKLQQMTFFED